jgi:hypothetical protein
MSSADGPSRDGRRHGALSRRACLAALAAATLAPAALPAWAQIDWHRVDIWKPYRREDLGYEVEMPGEPEIEEEQDEDGQSVHAELLFVGMMFGVDHVTFKRDVTIDVVSRQQRKAAQSLNGKITREAPFTMDGFPAIEIVSELEDAFVTIMRAVVIGNRIIAVDVVGGPDVAADPSALRFLNSFKLLPTSRKAE